MTVINRYNDTKRGCVVMTGNTLGLWGTFTTPPGAGVPQAGVVLGSTDGIGAFISLNTGLTATGGYPAGTTFDWTLNGSAAIINIPVGANVLYAELVWGGIITTLEQDKLAVIDSPVNFTDSNGVVHSITPDPTTSQLSDLLFGSSLRQYERTANVTNIVQNSLGGTYSLQGVPGALGDAGGPFGTFESVNLGWSLVVAYEHLSQPYRNLNIWTSLDSVYGGASPVIVDVPISGYITPDTGTVAGALLMFTISGDCYLGNDIVQFGETIATLNTLSGTNNPANNFFQSQINYADPCNGLLGILNTTGTFGNRNQPINGIYDTLLQANRQGTDITGVDITGMLSNNNTASVIRFSSTQDLYSPLAFALQLDAIPLDYGDAPDPLYKSLFTSNGPRHQVVNQLFIGTTVTVEDDALQNSTATGDSDDGIIAPIKIPIAIGNFSIPVTFTNNTGQIANVYAWIDYNQDGIFQTNESFVTTVISQVGTQTINLNFTGIPTTLETDTFMRVRITTDNLINSGGANAQDTRSFGLASDGEVEDYLVQFIRPAELQVVKSQSTNIANVGDVITYKIEITNIGSGNAINSILTDIIPNGTSYVAGTLIVDTIFSGDDLGTGVTLPSPISPNQIVIVEFNVLIDTIPIPNPMINLASVDYLTNGIALTAQSNQVETTINIADLSIVKIANPDPVIAGEEIIYTLTVFNAGPSDALNVQVVDSVIINNPEYSLNGGLTWSLWTGSVSIGTVVSGGSVAILVRGIVPTDIA